MLNAPVGAWTTIAAAPSERIRAVLPNPVPHFPGAPDNPTGITTAWTGGGVDQVRGELLLVANGGHADYPGNEGYAISLRASQPAWRRLSDPTPNSSLSMSEMAEPLGAFNLDGRPRAMHSTFACFGDDRMWFVYQNSFSSNAGNSTSACLSYSRTFPGIPDVGQAPLPWVSGSLGPWVIHPNPNVNWSSAFGVAAWDRVRHKVWGIGGNNNINAPEYWSVDTVGPTTGVARRYQRPGSLENFNGWVAIAHDLRLLVAGGSFHGAIYVFHLDRPGAADDWQAVTNVTGTGHFTEGSGAAYVIANHTLAIANPVHTGSAILKLQIPTRVGASGLEYDPAGTWAWTTLNPGGATISVPPGNSGAYSKWSIVEDLGNGISAIVYVSSIDGPVYVYRLPSTGL